MSLISSSSRERSSSNHQRALGQSEDEKTKKEQHQQLVVFLSRLFRALFFLSFFRDVSTLMFLHFFNRNEESFRQSLSLDTLMQSIQSTVVVEVRFKFSLSFKLSFFTSFVENVLSLVSKAPFFPLQSFLLPLESRAPWWWLHFWISFWIDYPGNVLCCCSL